MEGPQRQGNTSRQPSKGQQRGPQQRFVRNSSRSGLSGAEADDEAPPGVFNTQLAGNAAQSPVRNPPQRAAHAPPGTLIPPGGRPSAPEQSRPPLSRGDMQQRPPGALPVPDDSRQKQRLLEVEVHRLRRELDGLRKHSQDVIRERNRLDDEKKELLKQLQYTEQRLRKVQEISRLEVKKLHDELEYMERVHDQLSKQKKELQDKVQHASKAVEKIDEQQNSLVEQTQGLVAKNSELASALNSKNVEVEHLKEMLQTLEAELVAVTSDREALQEQLQQAQEYAAQQSRAAAAAEEQLQQLRLAPTEANVFGEEEAGEPYSNSSSMSQIYTELASNQEEGAALFSESQGADTPQYPEASDSEPVDSFQAVQYTLASQLDADSVVDASKDDEASYTRSAEGSTQNLPLLACEDNNTVELSEQPDVHYVPIPDDCSADNSPDSSLLSTEGIQVRKSLQAQQDKTEADSTSNPSLYRPETTSVGGDKNDASLHSVGRDRQNLDAGDSDVHNSSQVVVEHLSARQVISRLESRRIGSQESLTEEAPKVPNPGEEGYRPSTLYGPRKPASRIW